MVAEGRISILGLEHSREVILVVMVGDIMGEEASLVGMVAVEMEVEEMEAEGEAVGMVVEGVDRRLG